MSGNGKYKMGTIAEMTGLSPALLRAWERRYGLLEPERTGGGHRLYTEEDLTVLQYVKDQMEDGRSIGEVAAPGHGELLTRARSEVPSPSAEDRARRDPNRPADPIPETPDAGPYLQSSMDDIVQAAVDLDRDALEAGLDRAFSMVSPPSVVSRVLEPAARRIGELWMEGKCSVAGEHMASSAFVLRLQKLLKTSNRALKENVPQVVTASFPDELHEIGSLVVAYELTLHGIRVVHLGPALPFEELERALDVLQPFGVYLSVTRQTLYEAHRPRFLQLLDRRGEEFEFIVGGQGIDAEDGEVRDRGVRLWPSGSAGRELGAELVPSGAQVSPRVAPSPPAARPVRASPGTR